MAERERLLVVIADRELVNLLERSVLAPQGYRVTTASTGAAAERQIKSRRPDLMLLGDDLPDGDYLDMAARFAALQPTLPIILFTRQASPSIPLKVLRLGVVDWLTPPLRPDQVLDAVRQGLERSKHWENWLKVETRRYTGPLQQRVNELEMLSKVGRTVTAQLDLDRVLTTVVEAAVELTGAQEGSLLLLDETSGELYMRADLNFKDEFVRTFRLPVRDTLAGDVIRTGKPIFIDAKDPQKIVTSYLVYSLIYVPIQIKGRSVGVLGVDNRESGQSLDKRHVPLLSALADFSAVALQNAQLFSETAQERNKLGSILTQIHDGVIVMGRDERLLLVNEAVRKAFELGNRSVAGKRLHEVFDHKDLIRAIRGELTDPYRVEIQVGDARVYSVQVTDIHEVGIVATLHDVTYLKELDRIKTDFVNTVSHDLRSPLTAILGYVELIERSGEVSSMQAEFIRRIQMSVRNITDLISDLLNLGRIEVGLEEDVERVPLSPILQYAIDGLQSQLVERQQTLRVDFARNLPAVSGNPIQLRQVVDNLLGNAIKYTPSGGAITVLARKEQDQVILQVGDNGPGIPPDEQSKIFDRFYRASNASKNAQGTGLGLAIVKTIVENHRGRIWVDSKMGRGSVFTVVLPIAED